jgi:CheY-like chemotaxis protein
MIENDVIFVTAYAAYALRAFEAGALDYILKPLDNARFSRALERAKGTLARGTLGNRLDRSRELLCVPAPGRRYAHRAQDHPGTRAGPGPSHILPHSPLDHCQPRTGAGARAARKRRVRGRAGLQGPPEIEPALTQALPRSPGRAVKRTLTSGGYFGRTSITSISTKPPRSPTRIAAWWCWRRISTQLQKTVGIRLGEE